MNEKNNNKMLDSGFELPFELEPISLDSLFKTNLPELSEYQQWKYLQDRKLILNEDVNDMYINYAQCIMLWNKQDKGVEQKDRKPIMIYINSYGGDPNAAYGFIDMLKLSKTPVKIINLNQACSAASLIFITKTKNIERIMLPNARILIHQGQAQIGGQTNQVLDMTKDIQNGLNKTKKFILENSNIDEKTYNQKKRSEWCIYATQALKFGLCDKIVNDIDELY